MDNVVESDEVFTNRINRINTAGVSAGPVEATVTIVSSQGLSTLILLTRNMTYSMSYNYVIA